MYRLSAFLLLLCVLAPNAPAQSPCEPPALPPMARDRNIFDVEREKDLGDAIAEHIQRSLRVIDDPQVTGYLALIAGRIVKNLPPSKLPYRFFLVDIPDANAFVLPGGRVYVSRKLVALAQNEDELAGVIAHELGHLAAHHNEEKMTRLFREVLGVTQVRDRKDVFDKYNELIENAARKPKAFRVGDDHGNEEQLVADRVGFFAMVKAGYDPQAFARFFDRLADTQGKTGNFFSDMFGKTSPSARRLREMINAVGSLPPGCADHRAASSGRDFETWQSAVVSYTGGAKEEALRAVKMKTVLEPALRGEVNHLKFSPNGRYLLAQDDSGITVLSREPFAVLFRILAPEARLAQFTPDSSAIVFSTSEMRVEAWGIAEKKLRSARELFNRMPPLQSLLSPDGSVLAVYDLNFDLSLFDVATGAQIFQKKEFHVPNPFKIRLLRFLSETLSESDFADLSVDWLNLDFSTDGRFFAAGGRGVRYYAAGVKTATNALAFDLVAKKELPLKGDLKKYLSGGFAFLGPDRIVAVHPEDRSKSGVIAFPAGILAKPLSIGPASFSPASGGDYLLIRPLSEYPVGVMDIAANKLLKANKETALDIYGDVFVAERRNGELGLYGMAKNDVKSSLELPRNSLGRLRAVSISPDFKWLATSERNRGAIWNLQTGDRIFHMRGFRGAHFGVDGQLYADFPELKTQKRQIARVDPAKKVVTAGPEVDEAGMRQIGEFIYFMKPHRKDSTVGQDVTLELRHARDLSLAWSKQFPNEAPRVWVDQAGQTVIGAWSVSSNHVQNEIKSDATLARQIASLREAEGDYFVQVFDARSGQLQGRLLVETGKGSFRIVTMYGAGGHVVVGDNQNRVLVYSLSTGKQVGRVFGDRSTMNPEGTILAVENDRGKMTLYDVATMSVRDTYVFASPVAFARFSVDGASLFVLTSNQEAYVLDITAPSAN